VRRRASALSPGGSGFGSRPSGVQTGKIRHFPIVLVGSTFFSGLLAWIRSTLLAQGMIAKEDLDLMIVTDDPKEAVRMVQEGSRRRKEMAERSERDARND